MTSLKPFTIDELHICEDRLTAIRRYHEWLERERENDKRELHNLKSRLFRFEHKKKKLCLRCMNQAKEGKTKCQKCLDMDKVYAKRYKRKVVKNENIDNTGKD